MPPAVTANAPVWPDVPPVVMFWAIGRGGPSVVKVTGSRLLRQERRPADEQQEALTEAGVGTVLNQQPTLGRSQRRHVDAERSRTTWLVGRINHVAAVRERRRIAVAVFAGSLVEMRDLFDGAAAVGLARAQPEVL